MSSAFPRDPFEEENGPGWAELHVASAEGEARPFVTGAVNVSRVSWVPGGKELAFLAKRGDDEAVSLYVIPADGGEARRIAGLADDIRSYSFGPNGSKVAFLAADEEAAELRERREKGFDAKIFEEDSRPTRVWVLDLAAEAAEPQALPLEGSALAAQFGPKGDRLAVRIAPTPHVDDSYMLSRIRVVDAATGRILGRIENPGKLGPIRWSPDGEHLAFLAGASINDSQSGRLSVAPAAGGEIRDLLPGLEGDVAAMEWSAPDRLVYVAHEGVEARIGEVALDGTAGTVALPTGGPIWESLSRAENGHLALVGSTPEHPQEAFLVADGAARRLTESNPWLAGMRQAPQKVVRYQARDGLALEGLLIEPLDKKEGVPLPARSHGAWRPGVPLFERLAHHLRQARAGVRRPWFRLLLSELPGRHRSRRRVLGNELRRPRGQGVRRPGGRGRPSRGGGPRGPREGGHYRRLLRRLRDRLGGDLLQRPVRGRGDVRRHIERDLEVRHQRHPLGAQPGAPGPLALGGLAGFARAESSLPRREVANAAPHSAR